MEEQKELSGRWRGPAVGTISSLRVEPRATLLKGPEIRRDRKGRAVLADTFVYMAAWFRTPWNVPLRAFIGAVLRVENDSAIKICASPHHGSLGCDAAHGACVVVGEGVLAHNISGSVNYGLCDRNMGMKYEVRVIGGVGRDRPVSGGSGDGEQTGSVCLDISLEINGAHGVRGASSVVNG